MNAIPKFTIVQPRPDGPPKLFVFAVVWHQGYANAETGTVTSAPGWYIPEPNEGETLSEVVDNLPEGEARLHSIWEFNPITGATRCLNDEAKDRASDPSDGGFPDLSVRDWYRG